MSIESYDFSDFDQRNDLLPCQSLFARESPYMKGKPANQELVVMDEAEYNIIKSEEAELKALQDKEWNDSKGPLTAFFLSSLIVSIVGVVVDLFFLKKEGFFVASLAGSLFSFAFLTGVNQQSRNEISKVKEISDNRLTRLASKTRVLEQKILTIDDHKEKEELNLVRDFFNTKYAIYLAARNKPLIVQRA